MQACTICTHTSHRSRLGSLLATKVHVPYSSHDIQLRAWVWSALIKLCIGLDCPLPVSTPAIRAAEPRIGKLLFHRTAYDAFPIVMLEFPQNLLHCPTLLPVASRRHFEPPKQSPLIPAKIPATKCNSSEAKASAVNSSTIKP